MVEKTIKKTSIALIALMIIACLLSGCGSKDPGIADYDYQGKYTGEKYIDAMGCDIKVDITLNEDKTFDYYRYPMVVNLDGGGEMPDLSDSGTYEITEEGFKLTGEILGEYELSFMIDSAGTPSISGDVPTGGAPTSLQLFKDGAEGAGAVAAGTTDAEGSGAEASGAVEGASDYYIDLTELGMKLTIYLRLYDDGNFLFSNTPEFQVNKSSGTYQESDGGNSYIMVFTSVNGEDKSISDGLTSSFTREDDGSLDFTSCERIYYGSATATTTSEEYPDAKLIAYPITDDYIAPSDETAFTSGTYRAEGDGVKYTVTFFDDGSYILMSIREAVSTSEESGIYEIENEAGDYSVSTTQLAMEPDGERRISNDVIDGETLSVSVPDLNAGSEERKQIEFKKSDASADVLMTFVGDDASLTVFDDGTYEVEAAGFSEGGVIAINTGDGTFKTYPDHPENSERGLKQVATVPLGTYVIGDNDKAILEEFRVRTSDSLNRIKVTLMQE